MSMNGLLLKLKKQLIKASSLILNNLEVLNNGHATNLGFIVQLFGRSSSCLDCCNRYYFIYSLCWNN